MRKNEQRAVKQLRRSRMALFSILIPLLPVAFSLGGAWDSFLRLAYIILGFSLIIFLHELGHFLVARACAVKCLAFSIGIGPRMLGWRKGAGMSFGKDPFDPETKPKKEPTKEERLEHTEAATTHSDLPTSAEAPPHPRNVGDTDYRVSWLPLGGYVRMLGQDDMDPTKVSDDPRAFNNRPIWQRMCIVSAGVIMNLIFAAVCFSIIFSPGIGVEFPPAIVGDVQYESPAWKAGLKMGDEIRQIDGVKPRGFLEFTDVAMRCALSNGTTPIEFLVRPYGTKGEQDHTVSILPVRNEYTGFLALGVDSLQSMKVGGSSEEYLAQEQAETDPADLLLFKKNHDALAKLRKGDEIVAIDGRDVHGDYKTMYDYVQSRNGQAVKLTLINKNASLPKQDIELYPHLEKILGVTEFPSVLGLRPRLVVNEPEKNYPAAAAGIKDGDVILTVGQRTNPTMTQFAEIVANSGGEPLLFVVERDGKPISVTITPKMDSGKWRVGLRYHEDVASLRFAPPAVNSPADALNIPADATIAAIDGTKVETWYDVYAVLREKQPDQKVNVTFKTASESVDRALTLAASESTAVRTLTQYRLGLRIEGLTKNQHGDNAAEAVLLGVDHTKKFILQVYMTLAGLFRQTVSPDNLHGIVGITKIGYDVQDRGIVWLWYVLAMVSVNLAVANFLPLPIVDGGLFLLLILEKIRGRPLSLKVQSAIQVVGIVLLAGLFLFVTKNDIGMFMK